MLGAVMTEPADSPMYSVPARRLIDDGPVGTGAAQLLQEKERVAAAHIDAISLGDFVGDVLGGVARHVFHIQLFDLEAEPL